MQKGPLTALAMLYSIIGNAIFYDGGHLLIVLLLFVVFIDNLLTVSVCVLSFTVNVNVIFINFMILG